jgi:aminopeptidase N
MLTNLQENKPKAALIGASALGLGALGYFAYNMMKKPPCGGCNREKTITTGSGLNQMQAATRRSRINGKVDYELYLVLNYEKKYRGVCQITFDKHQKAGDILLDYSGEILGLEVNGIVIPETWWAINGINWNGKILRLDSSFTQAGRNSVNINFRSRYSTDNNGLTAFDYHAEDQNATPERYIFGWNEFNGCQKMFPNFDQPDIRGTFKLFLAGPSTWQCRSNGFRKENFHYVDVSNCSSKFLNAAHDRLFQEVSTPEHGSHEVWEFCQTEDMPSYLFGVYAGDWKEVKSQKFDGKDFKFRLYCTKSQESSLKKVAQEYFEIHNNGMKFYEALFGVNYPYSKYDITFVPKMSICFSACEYPGNVIYDETALEDNNSRKVSSTAFVMLHEMAHMWFGNLVNIGWWDELYLKEAMADYTSWQAYDNWWADSEMNKLKYCHPKIFFAGRKTQGCFEDTQQFASRALKGPNEYAADSVWMYSRITYGKGFSVMRELFESLGLVGEKFGTWCNIYLRTNANKTATEADFADAVQKCCTDKPQVNARDLCNKYFNSKGCDKIALKFSGDNTKLTITQTVAKKNQSIKPHYFDIAFYGKDCKVVSVIAVNLQGVSTELDLTSAPDWVHVLPNYNNIGYIDFELDNDQ